MNTQTRITNLVGITVSMLALWCTLSGCGAAEQKAPLPSVAVTSVAASSGSQRPAAPQAPGASAGRRVCRASTPNRTRVRYLAAARANASRQDRTFLKGAAKPPNQLRSSAAYAYLAARVYAMSVPTSERAGAYAGCAYELSKNTKGSSR